MSPDSHKSILPFKYYKICTLLTIFLPFSDVDSESGLDLNSFDPPSITSTLFTPIAGSAPMTVGTSMTSIAAHASTTSTAASASTTSTALTTSTAAPASTITSASIEPSASTSTTATVSWGRPETLLLIASYKEKYQKIQKKKELYSYISRQLQEKGYNFNVTQVENKCKTLLAAYRRHVDDQSQTGKKKRSFEFKRQLDELFEQNHDTRPRFIMGTMDSSEEAESMQNVHDVNTGSSSSAPDVLVQNQQTSDESEDEVPVRVVVPKKRAKKSSSQTSQVLTFLERYSENEANREEQRMKKAEQMHSEKN